MIKNKTIPKYKNNKWYPSYACHTWATPNNIINKPFSNYEQAKAYANSFLCDDDNTNVFFRKNNNWYYLELWETE